MHNILVLAELLQIERLSHLPPITIIFYLKLPAISDNTVTEKVKWVYLIRRDERRKGDSIHTLYHHHYYYYHHHGYKLGGDFCAVFEDANPFPVLPGRKRDAPQSATSSGGTERSCTTDESTTESASNSMYIFEMVSYKHHTTYTHCIRQSWEESYLSTFGLGNTCIHTYIHTYIHIHTYMNTYTYTSATQT